jgi:putative ABC transport system substrate-binding protein
MHRREFITLFGGAAVAWPLAARAQQPEKAWRVGQVIVGTPTTGGHLAAALEQQLGNLGYVQGRNITLLNRFTIPTPKAMEEAVLALIPSIDLLAIWGTVGGMAAKKFASTIPVVFLSVSAPVDVGLVESLAHPGGNMTGITFEAATETYAKRLQMLKEIMPSLSRVAVLRAQGDANVLFAMASLEKSAPALGVTLTPIDIKTADDLDSAFAEMQRSQAQALLVIAGGLTYVNSKKIADLALSHHQPSCHGFKETVADGGLVSLGPDLIAMTGQAAAYIDKIVRGAKPADLPVQQPTRYEVHVNLKTAKALGIDLPQSLLSRADEVIE